MPNTRIGFPGLDVLVEVPPSPRVSKKASGPAVTETFNADYDTAEDAIAARGFTFGDPCPIKEGIYQTALLDEISIAKVGPRIGRVMYMWKVPEPGGGVGGADDVPPVGTVTLESDSNVIDRPIGQNVNRIDDVNYDVDKQVGKGVWEGIEAWLEPAPTFTRNEILDDFVFSEANIIKNVAKRFTGAQMIAKGLLQSNDDRWLKMRLAIKVAGNNFEISETWQWTEFGWQNDLYPVAT